MITDKEISQQKKDLRARCLGIRKAIEVETRTEASLAICNHIEGWGVFQRSQTILTYMPIKSEADPGPLLRRHPQKRWILPRIIPEEDHRMVFHLYEPSRLLLHPFGMAEPAPDSPTVHAEVIELALVPGLAFDRIGFRLGYGGGYFDRFLKNFKGISAGIILHALLLDSIPHAAHDIPMQWVITEREIFDTRHEWKHLSCSKNSTHNASNAD